MHGKKQNISKRAMAFASQNPKKKKKIERKITLSGSSRCPSRRNSYRVYHWRRREKTGGLPENVRSRRQNRRVNIFGEQLASCVQQTPLFTYVFFTANPSPWVFRKVFFEFGCSSGIRSSSSSSRIPELLIYGQFWSFFPRAHSANKFDGKGIIFLRGAVKPTFNDSPRY